MTEMEVLYEKKCEQFEELNDQFQAYQQESLSMIEEIEKQNDELKSRNMALKEEVEALKEKRKSQTAALEKELEFIKKERNEFKAKFDDFNRKVVDLENINETLESENRAANCMLKEYETRVEKTMEELTLLQVELEENKSSSEEQAARLRNQLKETEEELYVLHLKHQKHNEESEQRRSRLSSSASFSSQEDISRIISPTDMEEKTDANLANILSMDFKRNKEPGFSKTVCLIKNLINEIDERAKKILKEKKRSSIPVKAS